MKLEAPTQEQLHDARVALWWGVLRRFCNAPLSERVECADFFMSCGGSVERGFAAQLIKPTARTYMREELN